MPPAAAHAELYLAAAEGGTPEAEALGGTPGAEGGTPEAEAVDTPPVVDTGERWREKKYGWMD